MTNRILIFNSSYPPMRCGVGDFTRQLAETVAALGVATTVVTSRGPEIETSGRARVLPVIRNWALTSFFVNYPRFVRTRPTIVVVQYPAVVPGTRVRLVFLLPLLARVFMPFARVLFIVHEFAHTAEPAKRSLRLAFAFANEIVVLNQADKESILDRWPMLRSRVRLGAIGSNVPYVAADAAELEQFFRRDSESAVVLFFGLLQSPEKGFEDLLEALVLLGREDAALWVSGTLDDSAYHAVLERMIGELGLQGRIHWLGFLTPREASLALQAADVVALPFRNGATPNRTSLLAALVNRSAILTTSGPAVPGFLHDGENVTLVPPQDPRALADALTDLLAHPQKRQKMSTDLAQLAPALDWPHLARVIFGDQIVRVS